MDAIPVTVVTGFLGAGKTTLVNRWLADFAPGKVAIIVNEYGAVGIDGALIARRDQALVEIAGGCVCCSTQAELIRALVELSTRASAPQRVIIETSGAASPAGVLRAVAAAHDCSWKLDGIVTVVDAVGAQRLADHALAIEQVGYADVVVVSRADSCTAEQYAHAKTLVAEYNGAAVSVSAARGEVAEAATLELLLALRRADFAPPAPIAPRDHVYESISFVAGVIDGERFADFIERDLARFAGRLFRTKGILAVAGVAERMIVQGVADRVEVTFGEPWGDSVPTSRFVIVGFGLDRQALEGAFRACAIA